MIGKDVKEFSERFVEDRYVYDFVSGDVITVNIAQGHTLKGVIIDLSSLFEFGSYFTAISRVERYKDIYVIG